MADNTRMKEIQGELKRVSETLGLHHDRFMQMDQRFDKIDQQLKELHQLFLKSQKDSPSQPSTSIVSIIALRSWILHVSLVITQ